MLENKMKELFVNSFLIDCIAPSVSYLGFIKEDIGMTTKN